MTQVAATAWVQSPAWELLHAEGADKNNNKKIKIQLKIFSFKKKERKEEFGVLAVAQ